MNSPAVTRCSNSVPEEMRRRFLARGARGARYRPQPERMADRVAQCRAIQGVKVKIAHAVAGERLDLLDRNAGGDHAAGIVIVIESGKALVQPPGNVRAAAFGKAHHLREAGDGQNARHQGRAHAGRRAPIAKAQENAGVVEELGDSAGRAGVDLALEVIQIRSRRARLRMHLRVSRDRDVKRRDGGESRDQLRRVAETCGARPMRALPPRQIATQRDQVANALVPVAARDCEDLAARGADAGEVRCARERGVALDARHDVVGAFARGAVRAVSHRHEARCQRREALDGVPQDRLHRRVRWREEFE